MFSSIKKMAEKKQKKIKLKQNKKLKKVKKLNKKRLILCIVILVVLALALTFVFFKDEIITKWYKHTTSFKYKNMTWYKVKSSGLTLYGTQIAVYRPITNQTIYYILHIRNDPRSLDYIPVNIESKLQRKTYVSFDAMPLTCNKTVLASWKLGEFIDALGLEKEGAFARPELANNTPYANMTGKFKNCSDARKGTSVVFLTESKTSRSQIYQEGYCYYLELGSCDVVLETTERFILALIEEMRQEKIK